MHTSILIIFHYALFSFVRSVAGTIVGSEDIDLNNTLYVMYGVGRAAPTANVLLHDVRPNGQPPMLSLQALNVVTDNNILILEMVCLMKRTV